jgi:PAS domain S-box-containing protein
VTTAPRIAVVGGDERSRVAVATVLASAGFSDVESRGQIPLGANDPVPDVMVIIGTEVEQLCLEAREVPVLSDVPILAVVPAMPAGAASEAIGAGADDVAVDPPSPAVIGARVRNLSRLYRERRTARLLDSTHDALRRTQELVARGGDGPDVLRDVLLIGVDTLGFDRASLIATIEGSDRAYVVAATDDPSLARFTLSVDKYPEVQEAVRSGQPVLIDDAQNHPITREVAEAFVRKGVRGVAVFPVVWKNKTLGALLFRGHRAGVKHVDGDLMVFARIFTTQLAAKLRHGQVLESLRDQTHRISRASYEAERRLRTIESLKEHFEAAADGVVILDEQGRMLFVNSTAERITGFARDGLLGSQLIDLVPPVQRDGFEQVVRTVLNGTNIEAFDLELTTTSGEPICASVTTSTVLADTGAVVLSFRDVTSERMLEIELLKTKEFLERLIDSTVDAIVAADTRGQIILFNPGAERIYGYTTDEVVGKMMVWKLYPEGVAKQVMRMLRSTSYGGVGRLEQTRREICSKSGELVPVNMTASIVYEDGREVATVGIFSDLRDRIRIEQRLLQAQEKLQVTEKQALVAELAGAAAHELNQPLTSIIGYAQLIQRQSEPDAQHLRAVNVILREGERMAEIVKKIGRLTKYEIKEYVGSSTILDLDKSSAASNPSLVIPSGADDDEDTIARERGTEESSELEAMGGPEVVDETDTDTDTIEEIDLEEALDGRPSN